MTILKTTLLAALLAATPALRAAEYSIDTYHSKAQFSVRHMMISNVRGEFSKVKGSISYDESNPRAIRIDATIDTTTVNTSEPKRDEHLRSADFLDTARFPTMTFKSKSARLSGGNILVTGDLTLHGVTREVVLTLEMPSAELKDPKGGARRGASATAKISRKDFGLTWNMAVEAGGVAVGDEVSIQIDIEATRPGPQS